jgi:hypothetical protein
MYGVDMAVHAHPSGRGARVYLRRRLRPEWMMYLLSHGDPILADPSGPRQAR